MSQGFKVGQAPRLWTAAGVPANGWKIHTYLPGSTTPLTTYSDAALGSTNANPIVTDTYGYYRCYVAKGVLIKFAVTDENDVPQTDPSFDNDEPMIDPTTADPSVTAVPTGGIIAFGGSSAPTGFLACDGAVVSRITWATLFSVISTNYGAGNGTTTFGLPDFRGRFPMGLTASGTGSVMGETGGAIDHTHTGGSHTHPVEVTRAGWGATLNAPSTDGTLNTGAAAGTGQFSSSYQPTGNLTVTSGDGGTGASGANNQAYQVAVWVIKT